MKKILSSLISFSLLFTQLAPLSYAVQSTGDKDTQLAAAGFMPCESTIAPIDNAVYREMISNQSSPYWKECRYVAGMSLLWQGSLLQENLTLEESTTILNATAGVANQMRAILDGVRTVRYTSFIRYLFDINKAMRKRVPGVKDTIACRYNSDENTTTLCAIASTVGGKTNYADGKGTSNNGSGGDGSLAGNIQRELKNEKEKREGLKLNNAYIPFADLEGKLEIPDDLQNFIRELNKSSGKDLEAIMEYAVRLYLDEQYESSLDLRNRQLPPAYLSLLFKLYMDKVLTLEEAWKYVTYDTPATAVCRNSTKRKCGDIRRFALDGLMIQPRFRDFLNQQQWNVVENMIVDKLNRYKRGSAEYWIEIIKSGIMKEGPSNMQQKMYFIVKNAAARGASKEDLVTQAFVGLAAISEKAVAGKVMSTPAELLADTEFRQIQIELIKACQESTAYAQELQSSAVGAEEASGAALSLEAMSVAIPLTIIAAFTYGTIYALNDAYGFNHDAKEVLQYYIRHAVQKTYRLDPDGYFIPQMKISGEPGTGSSTGTGQKVTTTQDPETEASPGPAPQGPQKSNEEEGETCRYEYRASNQTLDNFKIRISGAEAQFYDLAEKCGLKIDPANPVFTPGYFTHAYEMWDIKWLAEEFAIEKSNEFGEAVCLEFLDEMAELEEVKDSFFSTSSKGNGKAKPLFMKIEYKPKVGFVPAPEIPVSVGEIKSLGSLIAKWTAMQVQGFLSNLTRVMFNSTTGLGQILPKDFRVGPHERNTVFENCNPAEPRIIRDGVIPKGSCFHFHFEEWKKYPSRFEKNGKAVEKDYLCNHTVYYSPGLIGK